MNKTGEDRMEGKFVKQNDTALPIGSGFIKDGRDPDDGTTVIKKAQVLEPS